MADVGPWMHGIITEENSEDNIGTGHIKCVMTKLGRVITQNMKHIGHTLVTVEQSLQYWLAKAKSQIPASFWGTDSTNYYKKPYAYTCKRTIMMGVVLTVAILKLSAWNHSRVMQGWVTQQHLTWRISQGQKIQMCHIVSLMVSQE